MLLELLLTQDRRIEYLEGQMAEYEHKLKHRPEFERRNSVQ